MSIRERQALRSLEVALDYALLRVTELEGKDRAAFISEYKEWFSTQKGKERVWFSIPLKNTHGRDED